STSPRTTSTGTAPWRRTPRTRAAHALGGRPARAARLLGTAEATRERSGAPLPPAEQSDVRRVSARARDALGAQAFTAEHAAGRAVDHRAAADTELGREAAGPA
ncbi:hypothetical protein ACWDV7_38215, partial [Streptomyces sp. NPDC003362]